MLRSFLVCFIICLNTGNFWAQSNCLFKNPLCFYNTDVLTYLQVLYKNQQYDKIVDFFYGSYIDSMGKKKLINALSESDFGYTMKRVGIKEIGKNKWSLTYQRTIMGTSENFKISCALINQTCRVYMDKQEWQKIFK